MSEFNKLIERIHSDLCALEDMTEYKYTEISRCIDFIQDNY